MPISVVRVLQGTLRWGEVFELVSGMPCHPEGPERRGGALGEAAGWGIRCDLTSAAVGKVAWQCLKTHLPSLKHSQKQLATGASSWVADHRKQLAATNLASSAQMTLSEGTCHLHQLWEVHSGVEQEEEWCWR